MKTFATLIAVLGLAFSAAADVSPTWQELYSRVFTNTVIIWQAPTNHLLPDYMVYRRSVPRIFSRTIISNAIVLASFQDKGFPDPSTNTTCIVADPCNCSCAQACNFCITPADASINFFSPVVQNTTNYLPDSKTVADLAKKDALKLGVDLSQITVKPETLHFNTDTNDNLMTNQLIGRSIFFCRNLNGIDYFSSFGTVDGSEGFGIEFGSYGLIRSFTYNWSEVKPSQRQRTATLQQITTCIQAHNTIVMPESENADYFSRLRALAHAKKLTITKITPFYGDYVFGATNNESSQFAIPFAELQCIADFGTSNAPVRLISPILASEVQRLLK